MIIIRSNNDEAVDSILDKPIMTYGDAFALMMVSTQPPEVLLARAMGTMGQEPFHQLTAPGARYNCPYTRPWNQPPYLVSKDQNPCWM